MAAQYRSLAIPVPAIVEPRMAVPEAAALSKPAVAPG
jgi:hypothetical protein